MKFFLTYALMHVAFLTLAQKPFKEVTVDVDQKKIDSVLPIEQPFYLNLISTKSFKLEEYKLLRIRIRRSYLFSNKEVLYYVDIPYIKSEVKADTISTKATKATITRTYKKDAVDSVFVSEYPTNPAIQVRHTARVYVEPLSPNFYYYLVKVGSQTARKIVDEDLSLQEMNLFKTIRDSSITIPLGNTALDPNENLNRHMSATFGIARLSLPTNTTLSPYLGLRYNFLPINKWIRQGMQRMENQSTDSKYGLDKMAVEVGLTLNSIEDPAFRVKNTFGKVCLVTGVGYRFTNYSYISIGQAWYTKVDETDKNKTSIKGRYYVALSLDWDIAKTFNSFAKLMGVGL